LSDALNYLIKPRPEVMKAYFGSIRVQMNSVRLGEICGLEDTAGLAKYRHKRFCVMCTTKTPN
jgi:hypothetical protein